MRSVEYRKLHREMGLCIYCARPLCLTSRAFCEFHRVKDILREEQRKAARRARGLYKRTKPSKLGVSPSRLPEYRIWKQARSRCNLPTHKSYKWYGGRGIEFRFKSFADFYTELGPRPQGMSVDRINNDGHYEPGNVRWATPKEQRANQRKPTRDPKC